MLAGQPYVFITKSAEKNALHTDLIINDPVSGKTVRCGDVEPVYCFLCRLLQVHIFED